MQTSSVSSGLQIDRSGRLVVDGKPWADEFSLTEENDLYKLEFRPIIDGVPQAKLKFEAHLNLFGGKILAQETTRGIQIEVAISWLRKVVRVSINRREKPPLPLTDLGRLICAISDWCQEL